MQKKGDIAIETVVFVAIAIAVLVIVILIVKDQTSKGTGKYQEVTDKIGLDPSQCDNLALGRYCAKVCPSKTHKKVEDYEGCSGDKILCCAPIARS